MENIQQHLEQRNTLNSKQSFTPEELVRRHMGNPDEPITDEEINNVDLSNQLPPDKKKEADEEAELFKKDGDNTSYNAAGF